MSSKKLLFIISLAILAGSLMSFNVNPGHSENSNNQILNSNSTANLGHDLLEFVHDNYRDWNLEFLRDTLPGDMQERVAELRRKREEIRQEVQRIKEAEEAKAIKKAEAEKMAIEKEKEKANKDAIAQIKAEEKAKQDAIKQQEKAARKAEADRLKAIKKEEAEKLALEKKKQREADAIAKAKIKAKQDAIAEKERAAKKVEAERIALKKKQKRDAEAALKAEQKATANALKAEQDKERQALRDKVAKAQANVTATVSDEDALKAAKKRDAEIAKAAKKKERDALKAIKAKEREEKARQKAAAADMALSNPNAANEDALKAAKKRDAEIAKAAKKKERDALKAIKAKEREEKARQKAAAADMALSNPNATNEDAIKAAKKRDAEIAKAAKKKERAEKAALKAQQKAEAAAIAAERQAQEAAAAQAGLVYDEDPPGYETTPEEMTVPTDTAENPRLQAQSIEVSNKKDGVQEESNVITEPILPPPPPATDAGAEESKTKKAVRDAFNRKNKKRVRNGGIKLPNIGGNKSDISSEEILEECDFEFNEFDPITQKVKRGLAPRYFFSYTSDILKEYMQGEDYLVCTGGLIDIQGIIALNVKYEIDSPQARYEYGSIGTNAQMILQLIDGETITLLAEQSDSGRVSRKTGKTEFSSIFLINPREEKTLRKTEISAVRMVWGTGYEDYEVNELDFLINQFQCIDAARDN